MFESMYNAATVVVLSAALVRSRQSPKVRIFRRDRRMATPHRARKNAQAEKRPSAPPTVSFSILLILIASKLYEDA